MPHSPRIVTPLPPLKTALSLIALVTLGGCSRDDLYSESTFTENVYQAYAECDDSEIRFLSAKHNIQLAFDECGSNNFANFTWSPDGVLMYFQLTHGGHVLNGEKKTISTVPTETPVNDGAWIRKDLLAVPIGPADAKAPELSLLGAEEEPYEPQSPYRLAWFNMDAGTLNTLDLTVADPADLQPLGDADKLVMTAIGPDGDRRPYVFDPVTGETKRFLEWLEAPVERLVYTPEADLLAWSNGTDSELMRISDKSSLAILNGVTRAIPHPDGRYVALETLGEPISLFDQRTWNELSPEARERELARKEEWLKRLPEWAPREAAPPEIHILDLEKDERYRITAFYGDHFEWYTQRNYYCSFILWGIEGKQLHRNVALTDIAERLRMVGKGEIPMGIERYEAPPAAASSDETTPAAGAEAPAAAADASAPAMKP